MAIAFDAGTPNNDATSKSAAGVSSLTSSAYAISGANRYKVAFGAGTGTGGNTNFPQNMKWGGSGGTAFSALHAGLALGSFSSLRLFGLLAAAASSLTLFGDRSAGLDESAIGALNYTGVDQVVPLGNASAVTTATGALSGTTLSAQITGITTVAGQMVVAVFWAEESSFHVPVWSASGSNILRYRTEPGSDTAGGMVEFLATGTTTTITGTVTAGGTMSGTWGGAAIVLNPVSAVVHGLTLLGAG